MISIGVIFQKYNRKKGNTLLLVFPIQFQVISLETGKTVVASIFRTCNGESYHFPLFLYEKIITY